MVQIGAGSLHTCVLLDNNAVRCWGGGFLGYGDVDNIGDDRFEMPPPDLELGQGVIIQLSVGAKHACVLFDNGDLLGISGGHAGQDDGCGGDLANGYVIMIYDSPLPVDYFEHIKLLVAPYHDTFPGNGQVRSFTPGDWTPLGELSWNGGARMSSCYPMLGTMAPGLVGFAGSVEFSVY